MDRRLSTIHALAAGMLGDVVMAEDVAQTVMLKTWTNAPKWQPGHARLLTWMCRVATNQCLDILKKKGPIYSDDVPDIDDGRASAVDKLTADNDAATVKAAMISLPDRQRAAITLCYFDELSQKEAASILGVSVKAYESLLSRGRKKLRLELENSALRERRSAS
jgi:RNA polymerase sigma-70 factor (ECF subfamily)